MSKTKKQRQNKNISYKPIQVVQKPVVQTFEKSLFETLIMGFILSVLPGIGVSLIVVFFVIDFSPNYDDWCQYIFGSIAMVYFLCFCWLISTPCFSISKNEIVVSRMNKQGICYTINPSLHIEITMMFSLNKGFKGGSCLLFMTFIDEQHNLKKRWISGYYSHEQARDLIFGLEDYGVRYCIKGYNAHLFAYYATSCFRRIKESTL